MPDWIAIILLGIIEGLTEFLPVSSTGHLLIAERWLPRQTDLFNIVIQCGAVLAVLPLFPNRLAQCSRALKDSAARDYVLKLLAAFIITGAGGVVLEKLHVKLPETIPPVAIALMVGGILFIVVERMLRGKPSADNVTWAIAVAVGVGQLIAAVFPGASRSGTTILISLLLGLSRPAAAEFSFLVGVPTILAASALKIFKALHHAPSGATSENWTMIVLGSIVAAIVSFISVKWLLRFVQTHTFVAFGWYRIALGVFLLFLLAV